MAGSGSYADAVIGEAKSFDCAVHLFTIVKNYLARMAIVALKIGFSLSDKIVKDPCARVDYTKIGYSDQGRIILAQSLTRKIFTVIAKTSQKRRATVAAVRDIDAVFIRNRCKRSCKCVTQGQ